MFRSQGFSLLRRTAAAAASIPTAAVRPAVVAPRVMVGAQQQLPRMVAGSAAVRGLGTHASPTGDMSMGGGLNGIPTHGGAGGGGGAGGASLAELIDREVCTCVCEM